MAENVLIFSIISKATKLCPGTKTAGEEMLRASGIRTDQSTNYEQLIMYNKFHRPFMQLVRKTAFISLINMPYEKPCFEIKKKRHKVKRYVNLLNIQN